MKFWRDEKGAATIQWLVTIVCGAIISVLIVFSLMGPVKDAYTTIQGRTSDITGSGL